MFLTFVFAYGFLGDYIILRKSGVPPHDTPDTTPQNAGDYSDQLYSLPTAPYATANL